MEIRGLERPPIPTRRVWVEASRDNHQLHPDETPPPLPAVPVPSIPSEHVAALETPDSKRRSAPAGRARRLANNTSASPEVISNLIDSFSTLSKPDNDHNRSSSHLGGARSTPATPALKHRGSFGPAAGSSRNSLTDYEIYRQHLADELEEPDAAEPPVVRTSKRPSGRSEWSAPKIQHESGLGAYIRNAYARSTSSLASSHRGDDDSRSIGNLSIDSARRRRSLVSVSRESLDARLSRKKTQSRIISPTKEEFVLPETDSVRELVLNATGVPEHLTPPTSPRRRAPFDSIIHEEPSSPTLAMKANRNFTAPTITEGKKPISHDVNGPAVPSRRSSLRHSDMPNTAKNRLSREVSAHTPSHPLPEADEEEPQTKVMLGSLDGEPTEVTRRIRDLKARKEQREREARQSPTPEPQLHISMPRSASRSPASIPAPAPGSPSPSASSQKDTKLTEKKSRIAQLGAINVPPQGASVAPSNPGQHALGIGIGLGLGNGVRNGNSDLLEIPPQPATPLTPTNLPINYSYVVQTLSNTDSHPGTFSPTSSKDERRKSLGHGDRSVLGRPAASKPTALDPALGASSSRLSSPEPADERVSIDKNAKSEKATRSNSLRLKRRRWSHPEVPATVERKGSMKPSESLAVQPPQRPDKIVEERPSSADSIDNDVKRFIHHPRLSQKIRHPQSGRTIAFSEVGDPKGHAVFCCVGMGLTRYVTAFYDELAMTLRLRLITPDRPGVGESPADPNGTPLNWPDDVLAICQALHISRFSIMAHSAGAIYALATALRMPQHIRGRVHLLAPCIPPSQMAPIGLTKQDPPPAAQLPKSQRFLRVMPAPFLKIANTSFLSAASASLSPNTSGSPRRDRKRRSNTSRKEFDRENKEMPRSDSKTENLLGTPPAHTRRESIMLMDQQDMPDGSALEYAKSTRNLRGEYRIGGPNVLGSPQQMIDMEEENERREIYDSRLTLSIWALATTNANPAGDLLVCLERQREIGFMYKDITRAVVIHHGSKDTRVPVENVKWLGRTMRKCEVRVLEGEGHGLMARAAVMGTVLEDIAQEIKDWDDAVKKGGNLKRY